MYGNQRRSEDILELRKQGGKWLKLLREKAGLTQAELAQRLQMEVYTFISQLENGRGRIPPDRYRNWATALGVPVEEFVHRILYFYDPITYEILFGTEGSGVVDHSRTTSPVVVYSAPAGARQTELLLDEVRELQRLLGKKTAELETLKERMNDH